MTKRYLGDGVYVAVERGMLKLTAENGIEATDTIYLEPEVFRALRVYYEEAVEATLADDDAPPLND
jgi:hypothetical protein